MVPRSVLAFWAISMNLVEKAQGRNGDQGEREMVLELAIEHSNPLLAAIQLACQDRCFSQC